MKTSKFRKDILGTTACMKRLGIATKSCGRLTSNYTYFDDTWFIFDKTSEEAMAAGANYLRPTKTSHNGFCIAMLENLMKYWPGGSYLVMNITSRVPGCRQLLTIGYK